MSIKARRDIFAAEDPGIARLTGQSIRQSSPFLVNWQSVSPMMFAGLGV
ncbi:hypothetical protein [Reyranella sp.]|nr:hypothetical protein [Reyranella sp.]